MGWLDDLLNSSSDLFTNTFDPKYGFLGRPVSGALRSGIDFARDLPRQMAPIATPWLDPKNFEPDPGTTKLLDDLLGGGLGQKLIEEPTQQMVNPAASKAPFGELFKNAVYPEIGPGDVGSNHFESVMGPQGPIERSVPNSSEDVQSSVWAHNQLSGATESVGDLIKSTPELGLIPNVPGMGAMFIPGISEGLGKNLGEGEYGKALIDSLMLAGIGKHSFKEASRGLSPEVSSEVRQNEVVSDQPQKISGPFNVDEVAAEGSRLPPPDLGPGKEILAEKNTYNERFKNMATEYLNRIKDDVAQTLGDESLGNITVDVHDIPGKSPAYFDRENNVIHIDPRKVNASTLSESIAHEISHTRGVHEFGGITPEEASRGRVVGEKPPVPNKLSLGPGKYAEVDPSILEHLQGNQLERAKVSPDEHLLKTAEESLINNPNIQQHGRALNENAGRIQAEEFRRSRGLGEFERVEDTPNPIPETSSPRFGGGRNSAIATVVNARFKNRTGREFARGREIPSPEDQQLRNQIEKEVRKEMNKEYREEQKGNIPSKGISAPEEPKIFTPEELSNLRDEAVRLWNSGDKAGGQAIADKIEQNRKLQLQSDLGGYPKVTSELLDKWFKDNTIDQEFVDRYKNGNKEEAKLISEYIKNKVGPPKETSAEAPKEPKKWRVTINDGTTHLVDATNRGDAAGIVRKKLSDSGVKDFKIAGISEASEGVTEGAIRPDIKQKESTYVVTLSDGTTRKQRAFSEEQAKNTVSSALKSVDSNLEVAGVEVKVRSDKPVTSAKSKVESIRAADLVRQAREEASRNLSKSEPVVEETIDTSPLEGDAFSKALDSVKDESVSKPAFYDWADKNGYVHTKKGWKDSEGNLTTELDVKRHYEENLVDTKTELVSEKPTSEPVTEPEPKLTKEDIKALANASDKDIGALAKLLGGKEPKKSTGKELVANAQKQASKNLKENAGKEPPVNETTIDETPEVPTKPYDVTLSDGSTHTVRATDPAEAKAKAEEVLSEYESTKTVDKVEEKLTSLQKAAKHEIDPLKQGTEEVTDTIKQAKSEEVSDINETRSIVKDTEKLRSEQMKEKLKSLGEETKKEVKLSKEEEALRKAQTKEKFQKKSYTVLLSDGKEVTIRSRSEKAAREYVQSRINAQKSNVTISSVSEKLSPLDKALSKPKPTEPPKFGRESITPEDTFMQAARKLTPWEKVQEVGGIIKAMRSSGDLGHVLRQGKLMTVDMLTTGNVKEFVHVLKTMKESTFSEEKFKKIIEGHAKDPVTSKLITEFGLDLPGIAGHLKEEAFHTGLAEKMPGLGKVLIKPSERAYTSFLNEARVSEAKRLVKIAQDAGFTMENNPEVYKSLMKAVNIISSRGDFKKIGPTLNNLSNLMWAPRLKMARLQLLQHTIGLGEMHPLARAELQKSFVRTASVNMALLGLASLAGHKVVTDPRNSDWGKIVLGDTRIDPWFGLQPNVRALALLYYQERISPTTGIKRKVTPGTVLGENLLSGLAPGPTLAWELVTGTNSGGYKVNRTERALLGISPMPIEDLYDAFRRYGLMGTMAIAPISILGEGVNTFDDKGSSDKKKKNWNY